jgi:dTDP-4-amino-4,6-dideoxygalactose transaminase
MTLGVLLKSVFTSKKDARKNITSFFKKLTDKKYILITNSCRSALYLAYTSIDKTGEVITSPLTCKVAIDPVDESNNQPVFADVKLDDLTLNSDDIEHRITNNTIAVQAIHLGGISCDMDKIIKIAQKHNLLVIEDCAQSLGSKFDKKNTGSFGDIACFSLIKNAYGIGGGILATNSFKIYNNALTKYNQLAKTSNLLIIYRIIKNVLETYRTHLAGKLLHKLFIKLKGQKSNYTSVKSQLLKIPNIAIKIASAQIYRFETLHKKRKAIGKIYYNSLNENGFFLTNKYNPDQSSFTKLFIYHPKINTMEALNNMHKKGIESMHLEHKTGSPYQAPLITKETADKNNLINYLKAHDSIISPPLYESLTSKQVDLIVKSIIT